MIMGDDTMTFYYKKDVKKYLRQTKRSHLYSEDDAQLIENLKQADMLKGIIYEPTLYFYRFNGVSHATSVKVLYILEEG